MNFYDMRQYCYMGEESQGEVVVAFVRVSPLHRSYIIQRDVLNRLRLCEYIHAYCDSKKTCVFEFGYVFFSAGTHRGQRSKV